MRDASTTDVPRTRQPTRCLTPNMPPTELAPCQKQLMVAEQRLIPQRTLFEGIDAVLSHHVRHGIYGCFAIIPMCSELITPKGSSVCTKDNARFTGDNIHSGADSCTATSEVYLGEVFETKGGDNSRSAWRRGLGCGFGASSALLRMLLRPA